MLVPKLYQAAGRLRARSSSITQGIASRSIRRPYYAGPGRERPTISTSRTSILITVLQEPTPVEGRRPGVTETQSVRSVRLSCLATEGRVVAELNLRPAPVLVVANMSGRQVRPRVDR